MGAVSGLSPGGAGAGAVAGNILLGPAGAAIGAGTGALKGGQGPGSAGPLGGLIGSAGGMNGTGISGPEGAPIQQGVDLGQVGGAYQGAQQGLAQQQDLLNALKGQNGIGNQSDVFKQGQQIAQQQADANGIGKQNAVFGSLSDIKNQQAGTAQQYQNIANGTGPNPAQAALNNATGQNVANQAALMASQRGAGANVGLLARQAAQQGAATQQQAVGQGAQMQAQQQIAGLQGLAGQQAAMGQTAVNAGNLATQQAAAQQAQQQALAGQAATQVGQQIGATTGLSQGQQSEQGQLLGGINAQNSAAVGSQNSVNAANAGMANTVTTGQQGVIGGAFNGLGAVIGKAQGGVVHHMAVGGQLAPVSPEPAGPISSFGKFLSGWASPQNESATSMGTMGAQTQGGNALNKGASNLVSGIVKGIKGKPLAAQSGVPMAGPDVMGSMMDTALAAQGGVAQNNGVPAMVSEGEVIVPPQIAQSNNAPSKSAAFVRQAKESGGTVQASSPDQKAIKKGNSYDNDKIPKTIPEGSIVIPRAVMQSKNPERSAHDFVSKVLAKRGRMK